MNQDRRQFLSDVGSGMLVASIGSALALDLGLATVQAEESPSRLLFGTLEPLVSLMQETTPEQLQPQLIDRLNKGTELRELVAAAALANARALGGHNYDGYHTFMALSPALEMARELPAEQRALPVLKVIYRNATVIQRSGGTKSEVLHPIQPARLPEGPVDSELLRKAVRNVDMNRAESVFSALIEKSLSDAYNDLLLSVQDEIDVHRVVLAWRAWSMLDVAGKEQANTFLRQSVHYCVESERQGKLRKIDPSPIRALLPKLLDEYKLVGKPLGNRKADDAWIERTSQEIYTSSRKQAAITVAQALSEGIAPESIAEAICLAANRLILCDSGRAEANGTKAKDSVHGDSVGVHASDAANAWRHIARVSNPRNTVASLIVGAFHTAGQLGRQIKEPYPHAAHLEAIKTKDVEPLLSQLESAIKNRDQAQASALTHRYGELGHAPRPLMKVLLQFAISEDGALHAEKYYRTATEEFTFMRPAFRWRQLVALARVTASEYGLPAPGYAEACKLLKF